MFDRVLKYIFGLNKEATKKKHVFCRILFMQRNATRKNLDPIFLCVFCLVKKLRRSMCQKIIYSNTFLNQSFYGLFEMINQVQSRKLFRPCYVKSKWLRPPYFDATRHISSRQELFFVFVFILKLLDSLVCQSIRICCKSEAMHIKKSYFASTFCLNC